LTDQPPNYPPPPPPGGYGYPPSQPGGYGYPPPQSPGGYGYSPYPSQSAGTNSMAIASLVSSLVGLLCFGIGPLLGLVFGIIALNQIKQSGQSGRGMAIAGIVISSLLIALFIVFIIIGALLPSNEHTHHTDIGSAPIVMLTTEEPPASPVLISSR
jgi:hypothetical protein